MNYPVLKISALALAVSAGLHYGVGLVSVSGSRLAQAGVSAGQGGAAGLAARRVLQAEVQVAQPQAAAAETQPWQDEPLPEPDGELTPAVTSTSAARAAFNPADLPVSAVPRPNPNPVREPPSAGAIGAATGKLFASGDGGARTSAKPVYLDNPPPIYPSSARERGQEGRVLLSVTVSVRGLVREARVKKSSGYTVLDEAALAAVRKWKFQPATRRGETVEETIEQAVVFSLSKK